MKDSYLTIKGSASGEFKDRGSKFLGFAYPADSISEVNEILKKLKAKYHDARHHCYAYVLGTDASEFRVSDDGEPSHSAGDSILRSIRSNELTNLVVVVVRYFGGTKLGVRGLINAYYEAADNALGKADIITIPIVEKVGISYTYEDTNEVMQIIDRFNIGVLNQDFKEICFLEGNVIVSKKSELADKLQELKEQKRIISFDISTSH